MSSGYLLMEKRASIKGFKLSPRMKECVKIPEVRMKHSYSLAEIK